MNTFITAAIILLLMNGGLFHQSLSDQLLTSKHKAVAGKDEKMMAVNLDPLIVKKSRDFTLTGKGDEIEWEMAKWNLLTKLDSGGNDYRSRFKILYSGKGIYLLFNGEDEKITTRANQDFGAIYDGDAFEVFFHPNPQVPKYFEFEINQLGKVLILMISRKNGKAYDWIPWHYESDKQTITMVDVVGGTMEEGSSLKSWSAEVFFPYEILDLLDNIPPKSGTFWNANFCRLDYDSGNMVKWSWSPTIQNSFHELEKFRSMQFE
jgi:Carbohydrate-binding family 9